MENEQQLTDAENQAEDNIDYGEESSLEQETQTPEEEEQQEEHYINQEAVQKRINEITFDKNEEIRKREKLQEELDKLREDLEKRKASEENLEIPDLPDVYDDDFEDKIKAREEIIRKVAEANAKKQYITEQERKVFQENFKREQEKIARQVDTMYSTAKDYGISKDELQEADKKVSGFIRDRSLAKFILDQKESALIVKHLSSSAQELEKISEMDPINASVYIATKVIPEASKLKPGLTKTPDPVDVPKSKSSSKVDPFLKGVQFE